MSVKWGRHLKRISGACLKWLYFQTAFFLLFSGHAYAYIDPSAVTYMIQALAALAIAAGASFTVLRQRIVRMLRGRTGTVKKKKITLTEEIADKDLYEGTAAEERS